ncbi:uncharacterized protein G2W53_026250 [Senna tora]|uniref:Uncharacterized protein n=1 Tax=Senna tora TaxID=362788 RepID=A0A834TH45_9FABA|nr:uncharacterized protein G2W53_026250 [Senna tora]
MEGAWMMSSHIPGEKSRSDLRNLHELRGKRLVAQVSQTRRFALYLRTGVVLMLQLESSWHGRSVDQVLTIPDDKSRSDLRNLLELRGKRLVAQVSQTRRFALYLRTGVVLMFQLESSWHGGSVDHVSTYSGRQTAVGSQKPLRITRQKSCCASESNMSIRVVFANRSRFDAPFGFVLAWEERGSCVNIFRTTNHRQISETFMNYDAKDLLRNESNTSIRVVFANRSGFDAPIGVFLAWEERGSCLNNSGRQIAVGSQKPSGIMRQKTRCASESNTSVRVVLANRSGFDAPIGVVLAWEERGSCPYIFRTTNRVVLAWEERGSCLNIFWMKNRDRILETFTNYEAKDLLRNESNTSIRVAFANRTGFDAPIGVVLAWQERGSCLNIFRTKNCSRISETFMNYEANDLLRNVDDALTYSGREIAAGSQKPSQITRQKTCCASESNTSVRVVFATRSGFGAPIGVVLPWEERGSCLNIFRTTNHGQISETFTNYKAKDLLRESVKHIGSRCIWNRSGFDAPIGVVMAWEERGSCLNIFRERNHGRISETFTNYEAKDLLRKNLHELRGKRLVAQSDLRILYELRGKRLVAQVSQTRRFALYLRTGVVLMLQLESSWHGRSVDHVLTYSERQIEVGSQKPSQITRQKTCCAIESNTSVRVVLANRSDFDAPIGVVLAWEERGSCLNIFRTTNCGRISETFTNNEAKDLLRKNLHELRGKRLVAQVSQTRRFALYLRTEVVLMIQLESSWHGRSVDHVLTYFGRQIAVGSKKPSRITRQKTCCASVSNTSVRVVFANRSGFHDPIGVVLAWEERVSCLNIFRTTNRGRISEIFTNYEAKDLLRNESNTSVRIVFANRSGSDDPIGVVLAWEECGSYLNIFRTTNCGRISETFTNNEAKDLLRKCVKHVGSRCISNRSGFHDPIGVVLAWEERGSCLNIFRTTNRGRISEIFTNYEAKDLLRK